MVWLCNDGVAKNLSFEWLVGRYMDKYARLMQIMQPIATDVFKVWCCGRGYGCFVWSSLLGLSLCL